MIIPAMRLIAVDGESFVMQSRRGFTLIDTLAFIAVGAVLLAIATPAMMRAREMSKRMVCSTNLAGLGATCKIYATQNNGSWMVPGFKAAIVDTQGIDYTNGGLSVLPNDPGAVGNVRQFASFSETPSQPTGGTTAVSATRGWWLLVRSGDVHVNQFVCPSSTDAPDPTENVDLYYDFTGYANISYGYQVPFGPPDTRPHESAEIRQVFAADKGPFYVRGADPTWTSGGQVLTLDSSPFDWRLYNSPNHGGRGIGEGQNCLYADAHVSFQRIPAVGVDSDNIYTVIANDNWSDPFHKNVIHGDTVWQSQAQYPYPGQYAFGPYSNTYASTDSLIYP
jgi:Tfp pilus assembly protein PilE